MAPFAVGAYFVRVEPIDPDMTAGDQIGGMAAGRIQPVRKWLDHRGLLSVDVSSAWYFITICAESHQPWTVGGAPRAPRDATCRVVSLADAAKMILTEAREYHVRGRWRLALMLVMPDHLHFIVHGSDDGAHGVLPLATNGAHGVRPLVYY